jgi:hypothetical protein
MIFVSQQAKKFKTTPILIFDQPLWWKATEIQASEIPGSDLHSIILRMEGLYIQMSFVGAIGHLMSGSGIEDVLKCVYADTAVTHMLSGKAISRSVRGRLLTNATLNALIVCQADGISISTYSSANEMVFDDSTDSETQPHSLFLEISSELKGIANIFDKVITSTGFMTVEHVHVQASSQLESVVTDDQTKFFIISYRETLVAVYGNGGYFK